MYEPITSAFGGSYSAVLGANTSSSSLTTADLDTYAANAAQDVGALQSLNAAIRMFSISDDTIGKAVESIYIRTCIHSQEMI